VQFHPEATRTILARWIKDRADVLAGLGAGLIADLYQHSRASAAAAVDLFDGFAHRAGLGTNTFFSAKS
jgi:hypothetical protein